MLKISTRISLLYFVSTAVIIGIMAFSMYFIYYNQRLQTIDDELHDYAHFLTTGKNFEESDLELVFKELTERRKESAQKLKFNYNFILVGQDSVVYESDERYNLDDIIAEIMNYDESGKKREFATITVDDKDFRIYEHKLHQKTKKGELDIILVASLEKFYESLYQIKYILFILSPLLLIIAAFIGYFITRRAIAPVRQITQTAGIITGKNLSERVPEPSADDELAELARTFNDMIDRLERTINSQKQFIADASHDFRTPLAIVRLELELLLERKDIENDTRLSIEKSIKEIKSLSTMAENLLILARADAHQLRLNKTTVRLDEIIMETVAGFNKIAEAKNISFRIDIESSFELNYDKDLLKRLLNNAIANAIEYSPDGENVSIKLYREGSRVVFSISNYGKVYSREDIEHIFERFKRSDKSRTTKGFGLGMPIIKTIAEAHGGTVKFVSENGMNTLYVFFSE